MKQTVRGTSVVSAAAGLLLLATSTARSYTPYVGMDTVFGPGPHPTSAAAESNWMTAASGLGTINTIDFEPPFVPAPSATDYTTLNLGSGVTLTVNNASCPFRISNTATETSADGWNTTSGGSRRCWMRGFNAVSGTPLTYTLTFGTPIQAFGMYITGEGNTVQNATMTLNFTDGFGAQVLPMSPQIGCRWAGFTDAGQSVSSVVLTLAPTAQAYISIDDIRWVNFGGGTGTCSPNAAGTGCTGGCSPAGLACLPLEYTIYPNGQTLVTKCDCFQADTACHIGLDSVGHPACFGSCPGLSEQCLLRTMAMPDGSIRYRCQCITPGTTNPCAPTSYCNPDQPGTCFHVCTGDCPQGQICVPKVITKSATIGSVPEITECDCIQENAQVCRPVILQGNTVGCTGECPHGEPCTQYTKTNSDGSIEYRCCCPSSLGACCVTSGTPPVTNCIITHECECLTQGGVWHGIGSVCNPNPCGGGTNEEGACCQQGAAGGAGCFMTTAPNCQPPLVWLGVGTNCGPPNPCVPTGACCIYDAAVGNTCVALDYQACFAAGGIFLGYATPCTPTNPCPPMDPTGACCVNDDSGQPICVMVTAAQCQQIAGHFYGLGTSCSPPPAGPPICPPQGDCQCENPCHARGPRYNSTAYATFTGEIAVATSYTPAGSGAPVVQVMDVKNRATAPLNTDWLAATLYNHPSWTADSTGVGSVFGVTVDKRGYIYVTSTAIYFQDDIGLGGSLGIVYKLDNITGAISVFATLPNTGASGLGNIDYDGVHDQFFVSNIDDGRIYRISNTGAVLSTFDHATGTIAANSGTNVATPEPGYVPGPVPLGDRVWGVGAYNGRLYYSVWSEDSGSPSAAVSNTIRSIPLTGAGNFTGVSQLEITLPAIPVMWITVPFSNPVADISFSRTGCMLLAERSMSSYTYSSAHESRVLEYRKIAGTWWPSAYTFKIGIYANKANSAGGCDYDSQSRVYASGDALQFTPQTIYGIQSLPCTGGTVANSALRDLNGNYTTADKMEIGDVEIACSSPCYQPPNNMTVWFPFEETSGVFADNVAGNPNGTYVNAPLSAPGAVNLARKFNGVNQYVKVPNHALINISTGNFSFDAWIKTTTQTPEAIIDHRINSGGTARGYLGYVDGGLFKFAISDGTPGVYTAPQPVADGNWHHVAASVTRNSTTGMVLYVDGVSSSFDPTTHAGSLAAGTAMIIGGPCSGFVNPRVFEGSIDEVEFFTRALTTAEVLGIYNSGATGKCRYSCNIPPSSYCINEGSKVVPMQICNFTATTQTFNWALTGPNAGTGCTLFSPMSFLPSGGSVNVGPGSCIDVPPINVTIPRPAGLVPGQTECYQMTAVNVSSGQTFTCDGKLGAINLFCWTHHGGGDGGIIHVGLSSGVVLGWDITNTGSPTGQFNFKLMVVSEDDPNPQALSLNGLPPGTRYIGNLSVPSGGTSPLTVSVMPALHDSTRIYQIILEADTDGDGQYEPLDAISVRTYTGCGMRPTGDLDGDGVADMHDVPGLVNMLLAPAFDPMNPDAWCAADSDENAVLDGRDVRNAVMIYTGTGP